MDRGCLLADQGEGMFGEDYQVFTPDGRAVGQVLVLGPMDAVGGGKRVQLQRWNPLRNSALAFEKFYLFIYLDLLHCCRKPYLRQGLNSLWVWTLYHFIKSTLKLRKSRCIFFFGQETFVFLCLPSSRSLVFALCSIYLKQTTGKLCCRS